MAAETTPESLVAELVADLGQPIPLITGRQFAVIGLAARIEPDVNMPEARLHAAFATLARQGDTLTVAPFGAGSVRITAARPLRSCSQCHRAIADALRDHKLQCSYRGRPGDVETAGE
jgi:hypothetical protein